MASDPAKEAERTLLPAGKSVTFPVQFAPAECHTFTRETAGDAT